MWNSEAAAPAYLDAVRRSVTEPKMFDIFKSLPQFRRVVGSHETPFSIQCWKEIKENPEVFVNMEKFLLNDSLGRPPLAMVTHNGTKIAGDTLRYVQTVSRLQKTFGNLNGKTIFEWGSSYGGLAYCVLSQWPEIKYYTIHDLPEVNTLLGEYLKHLHVPTTKVGIELPTEPPDIFISELALTEQDDDTVYREYERYGKNAKMGLLMRVNFNQDISRHNFLEYIRQDFDVVTVELEHKVRGLNWLVIGTK